MERAEIKHILEAILFVHHEPLLMERLKEILEEVDGRLLRELLYELKTEYEQAQRGFIIREVAGGFQMVSHPRYAAWIKKLYKTSRSERLTLPTLETLAIIAYKQPITRLEIEEIRGVNVENILKNLLETNLIRIVGRKESLGRPILYGTTRKFLEYFGLNSLEELPKLEEFIGKGEDLALKRQITEKDTK
ncbi:MAG: SMC-Scp complex subunit ScpB [Candidatus Omnitrophica bacterium]|nr:SMC-Scp complex subunit ScpB [Candidatus Omnitrophota bacterium]MCM8793059.1 SMC-Scp complex subunit ScpB [Candidatus Omnitrophota bacterium]